MKLIKCWAIQDLIWAIISWKSYRKECWISGIFTRILNQYLPGTSKSCRQLKLPRCNLEDPVSKRTCHWHLNTFRGSGVQHLFWEYKVYILPKIDKSISSNKTPFGPAGICGVFTIIGHMSLVFANLCVSFRHDQHLACWSLAKVHEFNKLLILAGFVRSFTQIDVKAYCLCLYQFCEFLWSFPGYHGKNNTNRWISDSKKMEVFCLSIFSWKLVPRKKLQVQRLNHSNWYQERKYEATTNGHQWTVSLHSLDLLPRCSDFDFACANHRTRKYLVGVLTPFARELGGQDMPRYLLAQNDTVSKEITKSISRSE